MSKKYEEGQVFSANYGHWGFWPVRIARHTEVSPVTLKGLKNDNYLVFFFGSNDYGFIKENRIKPYSQDELMKQKFKPRDFKKLQKSIEDTNQWVETHTKSFPIYTAPQKIKKEPVDIDYKSPTPKEKTNTINNQKKSVSLINPSTTSKQIFTRQSTLLKNSKEEQANIKLEKLSQEPIQVSNETTNNDPFPKPKNNSNNKENIENINDNMEIDEPNNTSTAQMTQAITPVKRTPLKYSKTAPNINTTPHTRAQLEFVSPSPIKPNNINSSNTSSGSGSNNTSITHSNGQLRFQPIKKEIDNYIQNHEINGLSTSKTQPNITINNNNQSNLDEIENDIIHILGLYSLTTSEIKSKFVNTTITDNNQLIRILDNIATMNVFEQWVLNIDKYENINELWYPNEHERTAIKKRKLEMEMILEINQSFNKQNNQLQTNSHKISNKRLLSPNKSEKINKYGSPVRKKLAFDQTLTSQQITTTIITSSPQPINVNNNNNNNNNSIMDELENTIPLDEDETEDEGIESTQFINQSSSQNSQNSLVSTPPTPTSTIPATLIALSPKSNLKPLPQNVTYNNQNNHNVDESMDQDDFPATIPVNSIFNINNNNNKQLQSKIQPQSYQQPQVIVVSGGGQPQTNTTTTTTTSTSILTNSTLLDNTIRLKIKEMMSDNYIQMMNEFKQKELKNLIEKEASIQVNQLKSDILEELQSTKKLENMKMKNNLKTIVNSISEIEQSLSALKGSLERIINS